MAGGTGEPELLALLRAIARGDAEDVARLLEASPALARQQAVQGAARRASEPFWLAEISHYVYRGDSALHIAAAAHRADLARALLAAGADVHARNRRGAQPLHYAADGVPGSPAWSPDAQAATVSCLIAAGADPNAVDVSGVAPLHRAVRTRSAAAVAALLQGGADAGRPNGNGSTPMKLATRNTGRGGSGSPESKAQQAEIVRLLERPGSRG